METANRKLIRPSLVEVKDQSSSNKRSVSPAQKRTVPPETTNAENFYYVKQMQAKTPMVIVLNDGEQIHGCIEWYDRNCLKINRQDGPNLLVYKPAIKYLYKVSG
ncbi:MAG: Hfq-like protein [bacterium]|jgi:host factor-I protein